MTPKVMLTPERLQEIKEEVSYAEARPLEFPLVHIAKELIAAHENQGELLRLSLGNVDKLNTALEAAQQRLAEADVRITKLKSFLYSLRDVTTVAGAQIRRIDKIVDEAVDENSK